MRRVLALCAALLAACSGDTARDVLPPAEASALDGLRAVLRARVGGGVAAPPPPGLAAVRAALTPAVVAALPPGTVLVAHEATGAVWLSQRVATTGGVQTVLSEDGVTLSLRDGLVVASRGLGGDLMESDVADAAAALRAGRARAVRTHGFLDGEDRVVTRAFDCRYAPAGDGVVERCFATGLSFENTYAMRGGRIAASRQWLGPRIGHLYLEPLTF